MDSVMDALTEKFSRGSYPGYILTGVIENSDEESPARQLHADLIARMWDKEALWTGLNDITNIAFFRTVATTLGLRLRSVESKAATNAGAANIVEGDPSVEAGTGLEAATIVESANNDSQAPKVGAFAEVATDNNAATDIVVAANTNASADDDDADAETFFAQSGCGYHSHVQSGEACYKTMF